MKEITHVAAINLGSEWAIGFFVGFSGSPRVSSYEIGVLRYATEADAVRWIQMQKKTAMTIFKRDGALMRLGTVAIDGRGRPLHDGAPMERFPQGDESIDHWYHSGPVECWIVPGADADIFIPAENGVEEDD